MDNSSSRNLPPGPIVDDLLFLHREHRASAIFNQTIRGLPITARRCDGGFWSHTPIPDRVLKYIRIAGFEGILRCGYKDIDHGLITALVERWRPETHTFHFPVGEATVTLQDVEVLWGLRVDGLPVIGKDTCRSNAEWIDLCQRLLGFSPSSTDINGGRLNLGCLSSALDSSLSDTDSDVVCLQRARIYILILLGGLLFSERSSYLMPLLYLPLLEDLEVTNSYSWGSATLAHLYRNLCDATKPTAKAIAGPLMLLQLWAWERMPTIRPDRRNHVDNFAYPYGARWNVHFRISKVAMHVLPAYRDQFESLHFDQFIWQPYSEEILRALPASCTAGREIWRSVVYLICWNVIEPHLPNRVLRQFGLNQPIPVHSLIDRFKEWHHLGRQGNCNKDWVLKHRQYVSMWENRHNLVETGDVIDDTIHPSLEYITWFKTRTVIHISNPRRAETPTDGFQGSGSTAEYLMDVVSRIYHLSLNHLAHIGPEDATRIVEIRDLARSSLQVVLEAHRLDIQTTYRPQNIASPIVDYSSIQQVPCTFRGRRGGRRTKHRSTCTQRTGDQDMHSPPLTAHDNDVGTGHCSDLEIEASQHFNTPLELVSTSHTVPSSQPQDTVVCTTSTTSNQRNDFRSPIQMHTSPMHEGEAADEDEDEDVECDAASPPLAASPPRVVSPPRAIAAGLRRSKRMIKPKYIGVGFLTHVSTSHTVPSSQPQEMVVLPTSTTSNPLNNFHSPIHMDTGTMHEGEAEHEDEDIQCGAASPPLAASTPRAASPPRAVAAGVRRSKRMIKPVLCGTHGKLGRHK